MNTDKTGEDARNQSERTAETRQVVAVHVDNETYGIDIACIQAVIMPQEVARVPRTPSYLLGVTNLRGRVVPVLDLRKRFGLPADLEIDRRSRRIVVVEAAGITAGLVVDGVSEVMHLPARPHRAAVTAHCKRGDGVHHRHRARGGWPPADPAGRSQGADRQTFGRQDAANAARRRARRGESRLIPASS